MHENSIKFSLSSTDKRVVSFIMAQELAILTGRFYEACIDMVIATTLLLK